MTMMTYAQLLSSYACLLAPFVSYNRPNEHGNRLRNISTTKLSITILKVNRFLPHTYM